MPSAPMAAPVPAFSFSIHSSLSSYNVPMKVYLTSHVEYDAIAGAALVFDNQDRLLVLQRAAHDSMPNCWETPGGACDLEDGSLLHGVAREVWEESGLTVRALGQRVGSSDGHLFFTRSGLKVCKYSFEAEVESTDVVTLDPNEHQDYLWITEDQCRAHRVEAEGRVVEIEFTTAAQEATILEGFRLRRAAKA